MWGVGLYFAVDAKYSNYYAHDDGYVQGLGNTRGMFLARVNVGDPD